MSVPDLADDGKVVCGRRMAATFAGGAAVTGHIEMRSFVQPYIASRAAAIV